VIPNWGAAAHKGASKKCTTLALLSYCICSLLRVPVRLSLNGRLGCRQITFVSKAELRLSFSTSVYFMRFQSNYLGWLYEGPRSLTHTVEGRSGNTPLPIFIFEKLRWRKGRWRRCWSSNNHQIETFQFLKRKLKRKSDASGMDKPAVA